MQPDARRQTLLSELMMADGAEFDRRYVAQQTKAHREAVTLMEASPSVETSRL
jgi:predicted outer membrane protein